MRRYPCDHCGRKRPAEQLMRSRFTGRRFCRIEIDKCENRSKKGRRKREALHA